MQHRLFVAIDPPDEVREELARLQRGIPGARWVDPHQLHLTLRFVGDVDGRVLDDIVHGLDRIREAPFDLTLRGLGHFPPRKAPKVLWVGVEPEPALKALRDAVEREVVSCGVSPEQRKFHPHVTLARLNGSTERVGRFMADNALVAFEPFEVDQFHLYRSYLHHDGAEHTLEASYDLSVF